MTGANGKGQGSLAQTDVRRDEMVRNYFFFAAPSASRRSFPALNRTFFDAGMVISGVGVAALIAALSHLTGVGRNPFCGGLW